MSVEIWQPVHGIDGVSDLYVSSKGRVKLQDTVQTTIKAAKNSIGCYGTVNFNGMKCYVHRLVYCGFNNIHYDQNKNMRIMFRDLPKEELVDENGIMKSYPEHLIGIPLKHVCRLNSVQHDAPKERQHPVYGTFFENKWYDVYVYGILYKGYRMKLVDGNYIILNGSKMKQLMTKGKHDPVMSFGKGVSYMLTHVILSTFFPNQPRHETVDHINQNPLDHDVANIQWLSKSDNSRKNDQDILEKSTSNFDVKVPADEVWVPYMTIEVSNYGRVKRRNGTITIGCLLRGKRYRYVTFSVDGKKIREYVHFLVYKAFNPTHEKTMGIILHDDNAPKHPDGSYRNYLQDLRVGTHSENMREFHQHRKMIHDTQGHN